MHRGQALLIVALFLGGCAIAPPKPPSCTGPLTPINGDSRATPMEDKREARP